MSIVNFAVPTPLEKKISQAMKEQGFVSKAEFFRFAAIHFIHHIRDNKKPDDEFERAMNGLSSAVHKRFHGKKLPSLEEQFSDLR